MSKTSDSIVLDFRELQLRWAVDDVTCSVEKLIVMLETIDNMELLDAINQHLQALHQYVAVVNRNSAPLKGGQK